MAHTFNIQQQINNYVADISSKGSLTFTDEKELKAHLSDTIDSLSGSGLSEEEALLIACRRLGNNTELSAEFEKVNGKNMLNREWVFIFIGITATILLFNISSLLQIWLTYRTAEGLLSPSSAAIILSLFYFSAVLVTISIFRKGEKVTQFFKDHLFDKNKGVTALIALMVLIGCVYPFSRMLPMPATGHERLAEALHSIMNISPLTELLFKGTFPCLAAIGFYFATQSVNKQTGFHTVFKSSNYLYIVILGLALETIAAFLGRGLRLENKIVAAIFLGSIIGAGIFAFGYVNRHGKRLWPKIAAFAAFPFCAELTGSILRTDARGFLHSPILPYFIATCIGIAAGGAALYLVAGRNKPGTTT